MVSKLLCFTSKCFSHVPVVARRSIDTMTHFRSVSALYSYIGLRRRLLRLRKARSTWLWNSHARGLCHAFACTIQIYKKTNASISEKDTNTHSYAHIIYVVTILLEQRTWDVTYAFFFFFTCAWLVNVLIRWQFSTPKEKLLVDSGIFLSSHYDF